jgi:hypothetical protein
MEFRNSSLCIGYTRLAYATGRPDSLVWISPAAHDDDAGGVRTWGGNLVQTNSYLQTQTILRGLEFALAKGAFDDNAGQKRTAAAMIREMKGMKSVGGRHQLLTSILKKGATVEEMVKATGSSRRTIFRYSTV